jgi:hypothetical protein
MRTSFFVQRSFAQFVVAIIITFACSAIASAANQTFIESGSFQPVSTTLTNPYTNATATISGTYFVNSGIYNGQGASNTLLLSNSPDFLTIDSSGTQTISDVQRIVSGNGNDVVDLANTHNFSEGDCTIFTGTGDSLVWGSAANEIFNPQNFTNHNIYDGGPGTDTVVLPSDKSAYTITPTTTPGAFTITNTTTGAEVDVSEIEFAQFADQTISLPEPSALCLVAVARLAMRGKRGKNGNRRNLLRYLSF